MKKTFEQSAWNRLINVLAFLAYSFVVLVMILAAYVCYSERKITSATVNCADGTNWNALEPKNILYDSASLSGLCTNRRADGNYIPSSYLDIDRNAYSTEVEKESFSWAMIVYPLIVFGVGFGLIDLAKLLLLYIFTGRIAFEKSALLNLIVLASEDQKK